MSTTPSFQAVHENGVLRTLEPLALPEHQVVSVTIVAAFSRSDPEHSGDKSSLQASRSSMRRSP